MDKYEYKVRAEEIKKLVASKQYAEAMKIADTIDWNRVKSVMMLTIVSDIYKINRRYEDSKAVLLLAHERHPGGRTILYSLCELSIKMEEFVQAVEYLKDFVKIAPKDTGRYILQYKLYEAQDVRLEDRIAVLEEFKKRDYREKWAYELAYLYHRIGLGTKCVEECDELILWFGEGKYVLKAMELKMLHDPLNPIQQERYNLITGDKQQSTAQKNMQSKEDLFLEDDQDKHLEIDDMDIQVKTMDVSKYNTINLQKELADSMKELLHDHEELQPDNVIPFDNKSFQQEAQEVFFEEGHTGEIDAEEFPMDENIDEEDTTDEVTSEEVITELHSAELDSSESDLKEENTTEQVSNEESNTEENSIELSKEMTSSLEESEINALSLTEQQKLQFSFMSEAEFEKYLAQEYDGQLSLVVPESEQIEKQITGQMNIVDIMAEWEHAKKINQEKRLEDIRKRVTQQTGQLFSEFDEATKTDLLAKLEQASRLEEENRILKETVAQKLIEEEELLQTIEMPVISDEIIEEALTKSDEIEKSSDKEQMINAADAETMISEDKDEVEELEEIIEPEESEVSNTKGERILSQEEEEMFGPLLHSRKAKKQLLEALDAISLSPATGNIIISGEEGSGTIDLAKNLIKEIQMNDSNFSGKVARITGDILNKKNIPATFSKLHNGALIIERANDLTAETLSKILKTLDEKKNGIIVVLEDTPKQVEELICKNDSITKQFNARICVPQLNNDALVAYAKEYALEQEYTIDDLGVLALYTRIAEMQTCDYVVNTADVRDLIDEAIHHANKKNLSHFIDVLFGKRYDEEDMIILREKDFISY